jgi:hypothetical protein
MGGVDGHGQVAGYEKGAASGTLIVAEGICLRTTEWIVIKG